MIKVANIIEESKLGGPQIRIATVASELKDSIDTTVIMPKNNSNDFRLFCDNLLVKYKTFSIKNASKEFKAAIKYVLFFPSEVSKLMVFFKTEKFHLVHISGGSWQYKGLIAAKLSRTKVVWHLNDTKIHKLFQIIFGLLSRYVDAYIFASERSKIYYKNSISLNKPCFTIPSPVDTQRFNPCYKYEGDEVLIKDYEGKIVVGIVSNLSAVKGLNVFINAASRLNQDLDNIVFVVVGNVYDSQKAYLKELKKLCQELSINNINFVGARQDIRPLLSRFDIYVCSSLAESSPISVWEALSMKKPIVSTNVGDVPVYVKNEINGYIVNVGDFVEMARYIKVLALNKEKRISFGASSRQIAKKELDISFCAQRHLTAYKDILGD